MQLPTAIPKAFTQQNGKDIILVQEEPRNASQLIEIPITQNGVSRVQIPDIQQLRNQSDQTVVIKSLRLITPSVLSFAPVSGNAVAPLTELVKLSLTLYSEGWERGQLIPLLVLNDIFTEGSGVPYRQFPTRFANWKNVDWSKSYVQYSNGTGGAAGQPYSIVFDCEYMKFNLLGNPIAGTVSAPIGQQ